jgi:hypothetical protein
MRKSPREKPLKSSTRYPAEDDIWGIPESPEFSVLHHLMHEFKHHEADEERWLSVYKKVADQSGDPIRRFLLNMIVADEERHHELLERTVASLRDDPAVSRATRSPAPAPAAADAGRELSVMVERFLDVERKGIRQCEKLKKTSRRFRHALPALFCDAMIYDSLKHIAILKFLQVTLKEQRKRKAPQAS